MSRILASALLVLCTAQAQTFARGSSHDASAQNIYDPSEPNAALKARVESLMGLYLVRSPRRHRSERIEYRSKSVKATVWHPVGETSATELMTRAVKWLIFGRTQYATGARGVFSAFQDINQITLVFHDVIRSKRRSRRRKGVRERVKRYLALTISRAQFERLNMGELQECVERMDCAQVFANRFTRKSLNQKFIRRSKRAR
jgi:hypothetical protein